MKGTGGRVIKICQRQVQNCQEIRQEHLKWRATIQPVSGRLLRYKQQLRSNWRRPKDDDNKGKGVRRHLRQCTRMQRITMHINTDNKQADIILHQKL